ncbi:FHIPEP family type III secretion protein [Bacillus licheniformis]|nr:FHIPEP family type III secretion protein [Bacillus licheniformis]
MMRESSRDVRVFRCRRKRFGRSRCLYHLIIIQFIVITKGAERVSEVAARFTLDAMPGNR